MTTDSSRTAPRLAPPGAGLPLPELWIARLIFKLHQWRHNRAASAELFARERDEVLRLVRSVPAELAGRRTLIRRIPGLEDSSRDWSVFMTVEHLRVVNRGVLNAIRLLCAGEVPDTPVNTATVKPSPGVGGEVVDAFEEECADFLRVVALLPELRTERHYAHPWFGPLDAKSWFDMAGFHLRLHRTQIERILTEIHTEGEP